MIKTFVTIMSSIQEYNGFVQHMTSLDAPTPPTPNEYRQHLRQVFGFSADDLKANQMGIVTHAQKHRLLQQAFQEPSLDQAGGCALVMLFPIVLLGLIITLPQALGLILGGVVLIVLVYQITGQTWLQDRLMSPYRKDAKQGRVMKISGQVDVSPHPLWGSPRLLMGQALMFRLTEQQARFIKPGGAYTLYYAPHSRQILSIDPHLKDG